MNPRSRNIFWSDKELYGLLAGLFNFGTSASGGPAGGGLPLRRKSSIASFTLVELLIVIAILAVLAAAVVIVLNPAELLAEARDSQRVTDIGSIKKTISLWSLDVPGASEGAAQTVYISIPDTSSTCANITSLSPLPAGWSYHCVVSADLRKTDGTGWMPMNFSSISGGSPLPYLPIDPSNDPVLHRYYTYVAGGSYELTALLEAEKHDAAISDGGALTGVYQAGTHIGLTPIIRDSGLIGYWGLDGTGSISGGQTAGLQDSSGNGSDGSALNPNGTGMSFVAGKVGNAISFDGVDDTVVVGADNYNIPFKKMTMAFWMNTDTAAPTTYGMAIHRNDNANIGSSVFFGGVETGTNKITATIGANVEGWTSGKTEIVAVPGTWYHVVCSWDGVTARIYVDGVEATSYSFPASSFVNKAATTRIGSSANSSSYLLSGKVDDVRLYDRSLSRSEILTIYESER